MLFFQKVKKEKRKVYLLFKERAKVTIHSFLPYSSIFAKILKVKNEEPFFQKLLNPYTFLIDPNLNLIYRISSKISPGLFSFSLDFLGQKWLLK